MPYLEPDVRISQHLERIQKFAAGEKVEQVLERSGLTFDGQTVRASRGRVTDETCFTYKRAVRDVLGNATYSFAKVNFVLCGCKCADCA